jgi:uncharacterized protein YcbX
MTSAITTISRYPLKSAAKQDLDQAHISFRGIELDREFMVTQFRDGVERQFTQRDRNAEEMALIQFCNTDEYFVLRIKGMPDLKIPKDALTQEIREVWVHSQKTHGIDQGDQAAVWLSTIFEFQSKTQTLRLVRQSDHFIRRPDPSFVSESHSHTAFADAYPILVLNQESILDLQLRMAESGTIMSVQEIQDRMRANIVVSDLGGAFAEDKIKLLRVGDGLILELVKPCGRCTVPSINQRTANIDKDGKVLLATLANFRKGNNLDFETDFPQIDKSELSKTYFGMNAIVREVGSGVIRAEDSVEILEQY